MSTAAARRAYRGPALFSFGFRPFYLLGALWSALVVPLWLWSYLAGGPGMLTRDWHVHEMLFGFLAAIVAGFLTTAVPNWTGRMPIIGAPLAQLVGLWLAGRVAMLFQANLGAAAVGVIDSLFLLVFASVLWREVLAGRNWRNLPVCGLVSALALGNIAFHLHGVSWASGLGERLALGVATLLIALIGGRITPSFTRNWLKARGLAAQPAVFGLIDRAALALTGLAALAWVAFPDALFTGVLLALSGLAHLVRLARWRGWAARREPLVWILHLGYGWLGLALLLLGHLGARSGDPAHRRRPRPDRGGDRRHDPGGDDPLQPRPHRSSASRRRGHRRDLSGHQRLGPGADRRAVHRRGSTEPPDALGGPLGPGLRRLRGRL